MTLSNTGSLSAIAPELWYMTIQTMVYYVLASAAMLLENRLISRHSEK